MQWCCSSNSLRDIQRPRSGRKVSSSDSVKSTATPAWRGWGVTSMWGTDWTPQQVASLGMTSNWQVTLTKSSLIRLLQYFSGMALWHDIPRELRHNTYYWCTFQIGGNRLMRKEAEEALNKLPNMPPKLRRQDGFLQKDAFLHQHNCPFVTLTVHTVMHYPTGSSTAYTKLLGTQRFKM